MKSNTLKNRIEYSLIILISAIIQSIPDSIALFIGRLLGSFIFFCIPVRKRVTIENISNTFTEKSDKECRKIAHKTYQNFTKSFIEFLRFPQYSKAIIKRKVKFVNHELMTKFFKMNKGTICTSGHFGNWELMAAAIHAEGYPMAAIAREQRNDLVNKLINNHRAKLGVQTIQLGMALRKVLKSLNQNMFVAMLTDQDAHKEGIFVNFLGRPSSTALGPAIFCLKTGAPMLFGCAVRNKNGGHTVYLEQIKTDDLKGLTKENLKILTQRHTQILEKYIKNWPDHWFWMHKRWKTKPPKYS